MNEFDDRLLDPQSWAFLSLLNQLREWTPTRAPRVITASAKVNPLDALTRVDATAGAVTMTLESAIGCAGRMHFFIKTDSGSNGMVVTDGTTTKTTTTQSTGYLVFSNGTLWDFFTFVPAGGGGSGITIGTTAITSGTAPRVLYQKTGDVVGEDAEFTYNDSTNKLTLSGTGATSGIALGGRSAYDDSTNLHTDSPLMADGVITGNAGFEVAGGSTASGIVGGFGNTAGSITIITANAQRGSFTATGQFTFGALSYDPGPDLLAVGTFQPTAGYNAADTTAGLTANVDPTMVTTINFKNGLYVGTS